MPDKGQTNMDENENKKYLVRYEAEVDALENVVL